MILGYADDPVNALLGVDGQREATIAMCALGRDDNALPEAPAVEDIAYPFRAYSAQETHFSVISMMHTASSLVSGVEAAAGAPGRCGARARETQGRLIPLEPLSSDQLSTASVDESVLPPALDPPRRCPDATFLRGILDASGAIFARIQR